MAIGNYEYNEDGSILKRFEINGVTVKTPHLPLKVSTTRNGNWYRNTKGDRLGKLIFNGKIFDWSWICLNDEEINTISEILYAVNEAGSEQYQVTCYMPGLGNVTDTMYLMGTSVQEEYAPGIWKWSVQFLQVNGKLTF